MFPNGLDDLKRDIVEFSNNKQLQEIKSKLDFLMNDQFLIVHNEELRVLNDKLEKEMMINEKLSSEYMALTNQIKEEEENNEATTKELGEMWKRILQLEETILGRNVENQLKDDELKELQSLKDKKVKEKNELSNLFKEYSKVLADMKKVNLRAETDSGIESNETTTDEVKSKFPLTSKPKDYKASCMDHPKSNSGSANYFSQRRPPDPHEVPSLFSNINPIRYNQPVSQVPYYSVVPSFSNANAPCHQMPRPPFQNFNPPNHQGSFGMDNQRMPYEEWSNQNMRYPHQDQHSIFQNCRPPLLETPQMPPIPFGTNFSPSAPSLSEFNSRPPNHFKFNKSDNFSNGQRMQPGNDRFFKTPDQDCNKEGENSKEKSLWIQLKCLKKNIKCGDFNKSTVCGKASHLMTNAVAVNFPSKDNFMMELSDCLKNINNLPEDRRNEPVLEYKKRTNFKNYRRKGNNSYDAHDTQSENGDDRNPQIDDTRSDNGDVSNTRSYRWNNPRNYNRNDNSSDDVSETTSECGDTRRGNWRGGRGGRGNFRGRGGRGNWRGRGNFRGRGDWKHRGRGGNRSLHQSCEDVNRFDAANQEHCIQETDNASLANNDSNSLLEIDTAVNLHLNICNDSGEKVTRKQVFDSVNHSATNDFVELSDEKMESNVDPLLTISSPSNTPVSTVPQPAVSSCNVSTPTQLTTRSHNVSTAPQPTTHFHNVSTAPQPTTHFHNVPTATQPTTRFHNVSTATQLARPLNAESAHSRRTTVPSPQKKDCCIQ